MNSHHNSKNKHLNLPQIAIFLLTLFIFFGLLDFFNILPISDKLLNLFAKKTANNAGQLPTTIEVSMFGKKITACPVEAKNCESAKQIAQSTDTGNFFYALGFQNLPAKAPILAAATGQVDISKDSLNGQTIVHLSIYNSVLDATSNYEFLEDAIKLSVENGKSVKEGDLIGFIGSSSLTESKYSGKYLLIFSISTKDSSSKAYIKIKPKINEVVLDKI